MPLWPTHDGRIESLDLGLEGKLALISGSTARIGYAIAEALVREGARVIVNGRTPDTANIVIPKGEYRLLLERPAAEPVVAPVMDSNVPVTVIIY